MHYVPLANRVILREVEERKTTAGGLFVPDIARQHKGVAFGEVIAVGPGRINAEGKCIPCHVKLGDIVLIPRQAPAVLPLLGDDGSEEIVLMLPENDIIAVVHGLPKQTHVVGLDGAPLSLAPNSLAIPDGVYRNRDEADRTVADLKQTGAPPDVLEEVKADLSDEPSIH